MSRAPKSAMSKTNKTVPVAANESVPKPSAKTPAKTPKAKIVAPAAKGKSHGKSQSQSKSKSLPQAAIGTIFNRFAKANPEPKGELEHTNPYTLLVAVVLSAQATDAGVNKATRALFARADTPEKMLALGEDAVRDHIKSIGLYRNKAKNVILLSEQLIRDHGGVVPADRDALVALSGVGRKTANVVLNMAFGQKTMAVDTHVFRVAHRLGLSQGKTPEAVEEDLMRSIPDDYMFHAHHWLILHGRYTCLARGPKCGVCPIADMCTSEDKVVS